jgi:hypothetical protein
MAHPEESNGDLLALAHDQLTPPSLFLIEPAAAPQILKRAPQAFDPAGLVITRHEAISSDGTRIPYVQAGPPGETGEAPVHLTGYGGSVTARTTTTWRRSYRSAMPSCAGPSAGRRAPAGFSLACRLNAVHRPLQLEAKSFPIQGFTVCTHAYIR